MGKLMKYIFILISLDLLFILTGQINAESVGSIIIGGLLSVGSLSLSTLFSQLIGQFGDLINSSNGLGSLLVGLVGGTLALASAYFSKSDSITFIPMALMIGLLVSDFTIIYSYLAQFSVILATIIIGPLSILFVLNMIEWVRGKD